MVNMGSFSSHPPPSTSSSGTLRSHSTGDEGKAMLKAPADQDLCTMTQVSDSQFRRNGLDIMGEESRRLMSSITDVRALGIEDVDLPLPKLCVVGSQSTGKSSVIEAISEIRVPRASGTCTRCPLEINLSDASSENGQWVCQIYLVKKYYFDTNKREKLTKEQPFGQWLALKNPEIYSFCYVQKDEVADALMWAQIATLNPHNDWRIYRPGFNSGVSQDSRKVTFSPNIVRLDVKGPGLPNLCFYDLPGVIAQEEDNEYSPKLIRNLVSMYIEPENCIVLHTLAMNTDIQNDNSGPLLKGKNLASRTVGVLTKPDCVPKVPDAFDQWVSLLDQKAFRLDLGYYIVMNSQDSDIPHDEARAREEGFFQTQEPFASHLRRHRERFGTRSLQANLSKLLVTLIKQSLPTIIEKIDEKIEDTAFDLGRLPQPPTGNISAEIWNKVEEFAASLCQETAGGSFNHRFFQEWQEKAMEIRNVIVESWPRILFPQATRSSHGNGMPIRNRAESACSSRSSRVPTQDDLIVLDDEDICMPSVSGGKRKRPQAISNPFSPKKPKTSINPRAANLAKHFSMDEINSLIKGVNTGLPGARDIKVIERMHQDSTCHWQELLNELIDMTREKTNALVVDYIGTTFAKYEGTALNDTILATSMKFLEEAYASQNEALDGLLDMERSKVLTMDIESKRHFEKQNLNLLRDRSLTYMYEVEVHKRYGDMPPNTQASSQVKAEIESRPLDFEYEIQEMATARSYYQCASRRFADMIVLSICTQLFRQCRVDLKERIINKIGLRDGDANQVCRRLLEPDPTIAKEREDLTVKLSKLREAKEKLSMLSK